MRKSHQRDPPRYSYLTVSAPTGRLPGIHLLLVYVIDDPDPARIKGQGEYQVRAIVYRAARVLDASAPSATPLAAGAESRVASAASRLFFATLAAVAAGSAVAPGLPVVAGLSVASGLPVAPRLLFVAGLPLPAAVIGHRASIQAQSFDLAARNLRPDHVLGGPNPRPVTARDERASHTLEL